MLRNSFTAFFTSALLVIASTALAQKITVAKDGSGNYTTVQQAFDAIPAHNKKPLTIFIKKGTYKEKLHLDSTKDLLTLVGEDKDATVLTYDDHTGKIAPSGSAINTYTSPSFFMYANDFTAQNIRFENNAGSMRDRLLQLLYMAIVQYLKTAASLVSRMCFYPF